jgi:lipopolysaccharide export system permease protein
LIINRYLGREIIKPFASALGILIVLFASFSVAALLSQAVNGLLPATGIAELVALKVLISLEVLIPLALYVSVFVALSRLHGDLEFTAILALRMTPARVTGAVLAVSAALALMVAGLSLVARPWAYARLHQLSLQDGISVDVDAMEAGTFYQGQNGKRVIFLSARQGPKSPAQGVFVLRRRVGHLEVVHGTLASLLPAAGSAGNSTVYIRDAHIYEIGTAKGQDDQVLSAAGMVVNPESAVPVEADHSSIAASSLHLVGSKAADDAAELQWRLSTPLSTVLLGMLGLFMSRPRRQRSSSLKLVSMIVIYFVYDMLFTSARTWVQHGTVAVFPGIWWVPALLCLFLIVALYGGGRNLDWQRA